MVLLLKKGNFTIQRLFRRKVAVWRCTFSRALIGGGVPSRPPQARSGDIM
ncbi:hypothetical protein AGRO_4927 [Agrobacterium sp. ATCC 31749]|nr:hypothetical protein AGRO_4927 [Agrobacterium sp. ATCC 31749]